MKKYKFEIKTVLGDTEYLIIEGNTQKEAQNSVNRTRFISDSSEGEVFVNVDHIVTIKGKGEVKPSETT